MLDFATIWALIPESIRPFLTPAIVCGWVYYITRSKRSAQERRADQMDADSTIALRLHSDKQSSRIADLEQRFAELRTAYEGLLGAMRADLDRGWDLARDWCGVAHDQRHWINNKMMLMPEHLRPQALPPLPGIERRPGIPADQFPARWRDLRETDKSED